MKRVLITGGTGFVGRQIIKHLVTSGCNIRNVTRNNDECVADHFDNYYLRDLFNATTDELIKACEGVDIIIHSAWYAEPGKYLDSPLNLDCLAGTLRFAQIATMVGVKRFVGIGTCFEYDLTEGYLRTSSQLAPKTLYGAAKVSAFHALSKYFELNNVSFSWCRLFYLYGEGEDQRRLVPYLHAQLSAGKYAELSSGRQIRDFIDVSHAAKQIVDVSLSEMTGAVNICSGIPITVAELANSIADIYGRRDLLRFGARSENVNDPPCVIGEKSI
jgi:nucleoside-diphosphate-sugar epimerase